MLEFLIVHEIEREGVKKTTREVMDQETSIDIGGGFELRMNFVKWLRMNMFGGSPEKDISGHIETFFLKCEQEKYEGISKDSLRFMEFPYTFKGQDREWYERIGP